MGLACSLVHRLELRTPFVYSRFLSWSRSEKGGEVHDFVNSTQLSSTPWSRNCPTGAERVNQTAFPVMAISAKLQDSMVSKEVHSAEKKSTRQENLPLPVHSRSLTG